MKTEALFEAIESHESAARVGLASDLKTAVEIALGEPSVQALGSKLEKSDIATLILTRVLSLAKQKIDPRYENPNDVALFIYALLLSIHYPSLAFVAATVLCETPHLWWAGVFATRLLENRAKEDEFAGNVSNPSSVPTDATDRLFIFDAGLLIGFSFRLQTPAAFVPGGDEPLLSIGSVKWNADSRETNDLEPLTMA